MTQTPLTPTIKISSLLNDAWIKKLGYRFSKPGEIHLSQYATIILGSVSNWSAQYKYVDITPTQNELGLLQARNIKIGDWNITHYDVLLRMIADTFFLDKEGGKKVRMQQIGTILNRENSGEKDSLIVNLLGNSVIKTPEYDYGMLIESIANIPDFTLQFTKGQPGIDFPPLLKHIEWKKILDEYTLHAQGNSIKEFWSKQKQYQYSEEVILKINKSSICLFYEILNLFSYEYQQIDGTIYKLTLTYGEYEFVALLDRSV